MVVDFDRAVDEASVAAHFSLSPSVPGQISWPSSRRLVFTHPPFQTGTEYRVTLTAGYRSVGGGATDLDHTWTFKTEEALQATGWAPAAGERGVDPAAYLSIQFNHRLAAGALAGAFRLDPPAPLDAHLDPSNPYRVLIAPQGLLNPDQAYTLHVGRSLRDADGNQLPQPVASSFRTGAPRPLHGWLSYLETPAGSPAGTPGSLWIVDSNRLPRLLVPGPVLAYSWSPNADELAIETAPRTWSDLAVGGTPAPIGIAADWVAPLGLQHGFAYLAGGVLGVLTPAGQRVDLAANVETAAVAPGGTQIAYSLAGTDGTEIWALTVELRSRSRVQVEPGAVSALSWSPDGSRLAYVVTEAGQSRVRVRGLGQSLATTVVSGQVSDPAWDADSQHLFVLGQGGALTRPRIFRLPVTGTPQTLSGAGFPTSASPAAGAPVVAPDGHQVAFLSPAPAANVDELWLMNADGTGVARLSEPAYSCSEPLWTPA